MCSDIYALLFLIHIWILGCRRVPRFKKPVYKDSLTLTSTHTQRSKSKPNHTDEQSKCVSVILYFIGIVCFCCFLFLFSLFLFCSIFDNDAFFFHSFHSLFQVVEAFCYLYSDSAIQCWLQIKSLYELRNRVFCALHTLVVVRRRCCLA